jgi:16S rRNA (uracil1498-N3)-methyltransferase
VVERDDRPSLATFVAAEPLGGAGIITLDESEANHLRVRRLQVGAQCRVIDGAGSAAVGTVVRITKTLAQVETAAVMRMEPPPEIHLLVPIADRDRMLWLAEKATELGVTSWRPVLWRRSRSVSPRGEGVTFQQKVRARMLGALAQCGGAWLPVIHPDAPVSRALAALPQGGTRLALDSTGDPMLASGPRAPLCLALGPEGGLEADELDVLREAHFRTVSLAQYTLRFETAGVAALAVARAMLTPVSGESIAHG